MLEKAYDPKKYEDDIYREWEESGYFNPDNLPGKRSESFTMALPPPNVTGTLHIGHAYEDAIQDIFVRFNRMRGKRALWIPGTDHAAIATQSKVEKKIFDEEGKSRHDLGREAFTKRVTEFALQSQKAILVQLRKLGLSLDWSRLAFTLDDNRAAAVHAAFKKLYDAGLIYRGHRVVNWDPVGQTTVSDDEIVHKETTATLYYFRYSKDFPITIATTRPETKLGDTAVAVHPNDNRYKSFVGKTYQVTFAGAQLEIRVVADPSVDPEFGTGALGVTPAHSIADWELAERHSLPLKQVIDEQARVNGTGTEFDELDTIAVRKKIVAWLSSNGLLEKEEKVAQNISTAERTGAVIEPLPKLQWFVDVDKEFVLPHSNLNGIPAGSTTTLKKIMRTVVERGQIKILPEQFEKRYFHWVDNLRDWCISRQIWFGHRIPVWYKENKTVVSDKSPGNGWEQDPDTLDTWFSSGLWTFSTLGWPNKTDDLERYHPTDLMNPGYEILFLWVSRMIFLSGFLLGDIPFKTVLIHGIVRDEQGRKFSKSSGIGGDPLEIIDLHGTDALRMALVSGTAMGNDPVFSIEKVKGYKHFANKIWNASRFVLMNLEDFDPAAAYSLTDSDRARIKELDDLVAEVTADIESFRIHSASEKVYHYFWHIFADKIIEETKVRLKSGKDSARRGAQYLLLTILSTLLRLLHPFMPFVTELVWRHIPDGPHKTAKLLLVEAWPDRVSTPKTP